MNTIDKPNSLQSWLEDKYFEYQRNHGRTSLKSWSKHLGVNYSYLVNLINGDSRSTSMQTAFTLYEKTGDPAVLEILDYPVPDSPLVGFTDSQRELILSVLENVKEQLAGVPEAEQDLKLRQIFESAGFTVTDTD